MMKRQEQKIRERLQIKWRGKSFCRILDDVIKKAVAANDSQTLPGTV
jgi:hypothetical protein